jgi:DNA-binding LacI/PurR family transcriptional regulator
MALLLDHSDPPTAVFAMSDEMAFGALMELEHRGLRPGLDVSLIGVDDHEFARVVALTTISQQVAAQGALAARAVVASMAGTPVPPEPIPSPVELVVRTTTGPANSSARPAVPV